MPDKPFPVTRDEFDTEMAALRRDPVWRLQEAVEALICQLNRWEARAGMAGAKSRPALEGLYQHNRANATDAVTTLAMIRRDVDLVAGDLLAQIQVWDDAYFAQDDRLGTEGAA